MKNKTCKICGAIHHLARFALIEPMNVDSVEREDICNKCEKRAIKAAKINKKIALHKYHESEEFVYNKRKNAKYHTALRQARLIKATPPWANLSEIKKIYDKASKGTVVDNKKYHVDHIMPLRGKNVCGLHIAHNLQIITDKENLCKSNKVTLQTCVG